jgi:hypothetical protein
VPVEAATAITTRNALPLTILHQLLGRMENNVSSHYRFDNEQLLVDGGSFALQWTMIDTKDRGDERAGFPATSRRFRIPGASGGRLRNGKIVEQHDYRNMVGFLAQVVLVPAPPGAAEPST